MARGFNIGSTYIQILPSFKGFHIKVKAEMAKIRDVEIQVTPKIDTKKLRAELAQATRSRAVEINLKPDTKRFETEIQKATRRRTTKIDVDAEIAKAEAKIRWLETKRGSTTIDVDAEIAKAEAKISRLQARKAQMVVDVDADIAKAEARIRWLESKRGKTTIDVDAEIAKAEAKIRRLEAIHGTAKINVDAETGQARAKIETLKRTAGGTVNIRADADTAGAHAKLGFLEAHARKISATPIELNINAASAVRALAMFGWIQAAIGAIGYALPAVTAGLSTVVNLIGAVGQPVAAMAFGFKNVGGEVGRLREEADGAGSTMGKLTSQGKSFARFLAFELYPSFDRVRVAVQQTMLPRLEDSWRRMLTLMPQLQQVMVGTARVIGDLADEGSRMMTTGPWARDMATIGERNNEIFRSFGTAGIRLADALRHIAVAAGPVLQRFADFVSDKFNVFAHWLREMRVAGKLQAWFREMGDRLARLGGILKEFGVGIYNLADALGPLGIIVLDIIGTFAKWIGDLAQAHPTLFRIIAVVSLLVGTFLGLDRWIARLRAGFVFFGQRMAATGLQIQNMGRRFQDMNNYVRTSVSEWRRFGNTTSLVGPQLGVVRGQIGQATTALGRMREGWARGVYAAQQARIGFSHLPGAFGRVSGAADNLVNRINRLPRAVDNIPGVFTRMTNNVHRTMSGARSAISGLAQSATVAGTRIRAGLGRAISGITGALGGPWGAALMAAGLALSIFMAKQQEAKQRTEELKQSTREYTDLLVESGNKITDEVVAGIQDKINGAEANITNSLQMVGIELDTLRGGIAGVGGQTEQFKSQMSEVEDRLAGAIEGGGNWDQKLREIRETLMTNGGTHEDYIKKIHRMGEVYQQNTGHTDEQTEAFKQEIIAFLALAGFFGSERQAFTQAEQDGKAIAEANDKAASSTEQHRQAQIKLQEELLAAADSNIGYRQAVRGVEKANQAAKEALEEHGAESMEYREAVDQQNEAVLTAIKRAGEKAAANAKGATEEEKQRKAMHASRDEAIRLANQYIKNGEKVPGELQKILKETEGVIKKNGQWIKVLDDVPGKVMTTAEFKDKKARDQYNVFKKHMKDGTVRWTATFKQPGKGGKVGLAKGGIIKGMADGGLVKRMAPGGLLDRRDDEEVSTAGPTTFMSSSVADVVPPNTWRVIGDRVTDDEAFIPINQDARSLDVLSETARRMGFGLTAMAQGGVLGMASGGVSGKKRQGGSGSMDGGGLDISAEDVDAVTVALDALSVSMEATTDTTNTLNAQGFSPLQQDIQNSTVPALQVLQEQAGVRSVASVDLLRSSTAPLRTAMNNTGRNAEQNWRNITARVSGSTTSQRGSFNQLNQGMAGVRSNQNNTWTSADRNWRNISSRVSSSTTSQRGSFNLLNQGMSGVRSNKNQTGSTAERQWRSINTSVANSVRNQRNAFSSLNSGMSSVRSAMTSTADWAVRQYGRIRNAAANPIRWTLQNPFNRGIIAAWNKLNSEFSFNKRVSPVSVGFNRGGQVPGGQGNTDTVPAKLTPGEVVIRKEIAEPHKDFLLALNQGQAEAVQAAGGRYAKMPSGYNKGGEVGTGSGIKSAIARGVKVAKRMHGKKYRWAGASYAGADCSGFMSMIHNALVNQPVQRRRFSTAALGNGRRYGYRPGLKSAFAIGNNPGRHMAGTLAGTNVESGGSHNTSAYGSPAVGADNSQFRIRMHLPVVGGKFRSGGAGGGGFDFMAEIKEAFDPTRRMINQITQKWPGNKMAEQGKGISAEALKRTEAYAEKKFEETMGDPGGAGVQRWAPLVLRALRMVGQPASLLQTVLRRMNQESGGDPNIVNNWDSNASRGTPSKGLMQVIQPTFDAYRHPSLPNNLTHPLANIVASMRYAMSRYGSLSSAYNRAGGYDDGGVLPPGWTNVYNGTGGPEYVLTQPQAHDLVEQAKGGTGIQINGPIHNHMSPNAVTERQMQEQWRRMEALHGMR